MIVIGHRGASGYRPENTLSAFRAAAALGCNWIELDVRAVDGRLLVIHDEQLARTTNGTGTLSDHSLEALRALDAGMGERIPFLEEVLDTFAGSVSINVELKGLGAAELTSQLLNKACNEGTWQSHQFLISAFNHRELVKADQQFSRGILWGKTHPEMIDRSLALGGQWMNIELQAATADLIDSAHEAGLKVAVYTVNDPDDIEAMRALTVDAIFCDYPDRAMTTD
jgi:glycerophosphoryl diester phosphodiesterase